MKEPESVKKRNKQGNICSISANGIAGDTVEEHVKKSKGSIPCSVGTGGSAVEPVTWLRGWAGPTVHLSHHTEIPWLWVTSAHSYQDIFLESGSLTEEPLIKDPLHERTFFCQYFK